LVHSDLGSGGQWLLLGPTPKGLIHAVALLIDQYVDTGLYFLVRKQGGGTDVLLNLGGFVREASFSFEWRVYD